MMKLPHIKYSTTKSFLWISMLFVLSCSKSDSNFSPTGKGGSMAKFTITRNHLYIIERDHLQSYNITYLDNPVLESKFYVGSNIETIFPYGTNLFLGSQNGVYIYDITDPSSPSRQSIYSHLTSCDPVVVEDNYAYATLWSESRCARGVNSLDIIDISNINAPEQVNSISMDSPRGLGIDDSLLFVCDKGLKVFNVKNPALPLLIKKIEGISAYDLIPDSHLLVVTGSDGIYQYDYSDPMNIKLLSTIPIE